MIIFNDHVFLCKKVIWQRRALVYCNKMHYAILKARQTMSISLHIFVLIDRVHRIINYHLHFSST